MDNNTVADTGIDRVITCGVRWGSTANSYADLMTANGVCILASEHGSIELFRSIEEGDLIALKDGRNIIALGKPKLSDEGKTLTKKNVFWLDLFRNTLNLRLSDDQLNEKASHFEFELMDRIDVITIEEWVLLDTPIYYPLVQGTVTIRDEYVKQECINRFNKLSTSTEEYIVRETNYNLKNAQYLFSEYTATSDDDKNKKTLLKELLNSLDIVLNYDPENKIAKNLKESITTDGFLMTKSSKDLVDVYDHKAKSLRKINWRYTIAFITTLVVFMVLSVLYIISDYTSNITSENLKVFIFTKGIIISSIIASIIWLARFFNKRVHENVYLIEDYEHKSLIFGSLQNLKDVFVDEITPDVFRDIITKVIENPAINLLKIKDTKPHKVEIDLKEVVKKVASELPK